MIRRIIILISFLVHFVSVQAQESNMKTQVISTQIGHIEIQQKIVENTIPVIFLHGVYFDHYLWNYQVSKITDRTVISIDMPLHGNSKEKVGINWSLEDCGNMLIEILDSLNHLKVIAIGHSWGSMTILRAASTNPERFKSIGLYNMPTEAGTKKIKRQFNIVHLLIPFRSFYTKQVAKSIFGKQSLKEHPELLEYLDLSMSKLTADEIKATDQNVIVAADDASELVEKLKVPALSLKGAEDYVPIHKSIQMTIVKGGHVSPLEDRDAVLNHIREVIQISN